MKNRIRTFNKLEQKVKNECKMYKKADIDIAD